MDLVGPTVDALVAFAGAGRGVPAADVDAIEAGLGVTLPADVRPVAAAFGGGPIGEGFEHFSWSPSDPVNVLERTRHFRAQGLPATAVALAVAGRLLHALSFEGLEPMVRSFFLADARTPATLESPPREQDRVYFFSYHGFLLDRLETLRYVPVRAALVRRFKSIAPPAARQWRHRWAPHEAERIEEALRRGVRAADRLPTHVVDGREYVDLRGYVVPDRYRPLPPQPAPPPPAPVWHERLDLSFASGSFFDLHARDCLFRGARVSSAQGRFERCDFTMADVARADRRCVGRAFADCDFTGAYLAGCNMYGRYERCDFTGADLWRAAVADPAEDTTDGAIDCTLRDARVSGDFGAWRDLKYATPRGRR